MNKPTDTKIIALADETRTGEPGREGYILPISFAHAVLAKWGQPAHSGEPVAWKHDCAALLTNDVELWIDACPHCGKPRNAPQPVERVPLPSIASVEMIDAAMVEMRKIYPPLRRSECRQLIDAALSAAHGIKGGQHGTE